MSEILESMHDLAKSLHKVRAMDEVTMKAMDDLCLPDPEKDTDEPARPCRPPRRDTGTG